MANIDRYSSRFGVYIRTIIGVDPEIYGSTYIGTEIDSKHEVRRSVSTPGFKTKPRKRKFHGASLPENPFYYSKEYQGPVSGVLQRFVFNGYGSAYHYIYSGEGLHQFTGYMDLDSNAAVITDADRSAVNAAAVTKLLLKMKDQKVNLAQAFAERSMTANLLAETATRIYRTIRDLRKGDIVSAASHIGITQLSKRTIKKYRREFKRAPASAPAGGWLQLQYGWQPLLNDVYGSAELLASIPFREIINRATATSKTVIHNNSSKYLKNTVNGYDGLQTVNSVAEYQVKYTCYFAVGNEALHTLSSVGISNPTLLAWELLPFSFVADWFLPIGNYLSSFDATLGLQFLKGSKTIIRKVSTSGRRVGQKGGQSIRTSGTSTNISSSKEVFVVQRVPIYGFPSTQFPSFKNPVSFIHAANAVALLTQLFKK